MIKGMNKIETCLTNAEINELLHVESTCQPTQWNIHFPGLAYSTQTVARSTVGGIQYTRQC